MNYDLMNNNKLELTGLVSAPLKFTHELLGESFYETSLKVKRLSGMTDVIPLTVSDRLTMGCELSVGERITVRGQFRSHNKMVGDKSKLVLTAFARDIEEAKEGEPDTNYLEVCGYICKAPIYRVTPFNREICDVLLAVNRAYNKSDYIPCILWGRSARYAKSLPIGSKVAMWGRIQSRTYTKNLSENITEERVAYEFSVNRFKVDEGVKRSDSECEIRHNTAKLF